MANLEEQAQEREIDGVTYQVWPLGWKVGKAALCRLSAVLAPVLAAVFRASTQNEMAAAVFDALPSVLTNDDTDYFAKLFGDASRYKNEKGDWVPLVEKNHADHFQGRYLAYLQWIAFACEVNYAGFFRGWKSGAGIDAFLRTVTPK